MDMRDQNNPVIKQKPRLTAAAFIQISFLNIIINGIQEQAHYAVNP